MSSNPSARNPSNPADLVGGKSVVPQTGEAYDARDRGPVANFGLLARRTGRAWLAASLGRRSMSSRPEIDRRTFMKVGSGVLAAGLAPSLGAEARALSGAPYAVKWYPFTGHPDSDTCWSLSVGPDGRIYAAACAESLPGGVVKPVRYNEQRDDLDYLFDLAEKVDDPGDSGVLRSARSITASRLRCTMTCCTWQHIFQVRPSICLFIRRGTPGTTRSVAFVAPRCSLSTLAPTTFSGGTRSSRRRAAAAYCTMKSAACSTP